MQNLLIIEADIAVRSHNVNAAAAQIVKAKCDLDIAENSYNTAEEAFLNVYDRLCFCMNNHIIQGATTRAEYKKTIIDLKLLEYDITIYKNIHKFHETHCKGK